MTKKPVGLGSAATIATMDFETYSEAGFVWDANANKWTCLKGAPSNKKGLKIVGTAVYAQHPSTEVLCLHYNLEDGRGVQRWRPEFGRLPSDLIDYLAAGGLVEAHNSGFEWWIWNSVCTKKYGFPALRQASLRCSMAKARAYGLPGALGQLTGVLDLAIQKDKGGTRLINRFSIPRNPTKNDERRRILPSEDSEGESFWQYCDVDVMSESSASEVIPDLEGEELAYWHIDQKINQRGVAVDVDGVQDAIAIIDQAHGEYNDELARITGGIKASQLQQLKGWLAAKGCLMSTMDEENINAMLDGPVPTPECRRVLEIRQAVGSASVKKVFTMANQVTEAGRLHNLFNYHGARTGRPTGEGPQPTNLPKAGPNLCECICGKHHAVGRTECPWCAMPVPPNKAPLDWSNDMVEEVLEVMRSRSYHLLEYYYGEAMSAVSGCLRGLFVAKEGHEFICSDFNSIEGVVVAQLAGEEWRLEVFRTHGKIYEMSASKTTGVPFEDMMEYKRTTGNHHPMRNKIGKFTELALGFGGWINAMVQFGADKFLNESEMKEAILGWRESSPMIVEFWGGQFKGLPWDNNVVMGLYGLEGAAIQAVQTPGVWFWYREIAYLCWNDVLFCRLPSGRHISYQRPKLSPDDWFGVPTVKLTYEGWNSNPKMGPIGWNMINTYGARLAENVVQAVARDIQRNAQFNLEANNYPVVLHVYDENVSEVPIGYGSIEEMESLMQRMPPWAEGWPIRATGGWRGRRYRKD